MFLFAILFHHDNCFHILQEAALLEAPCVTELAGRPLRLVRVCSAVDEQTLREALEEFTDTLLSMYTEAFVR